MVQRRRQALWPYMKAAHQGDPSNPSGEVNAYLRVDKLFINNQKFTHDMTSSIPAYITDRVNNPPSMKCNDETTVFFTKTSPLSNFHASTFKVDDQNYKCVEQYLSYKKAMLFGADKVARDVLRTVDPVGMKRLVKHLPGYDRETWQAEAPKILHDAHIAKFTQNPSLRDALLWRRIRFIISVIDRGRNHFDRGRIHFDRGQILFDRGRNHFDRGRNLFDRGRILFDRGRILFDRGLILFDRGQNDFDRGQNYFDRGQNYFSPNREPPYKITKLLMISSCKT